MMRTRHATAIILAAAVLATGCTATSQPSATRRAGGLSVRLAAAERRVHCAQWRQQHATPLPAGFVAAAAVRCVEAFITVHGQGREGWIEQQASRDLAPLVAALREPSSPPPAIPCQLRYVAPLALFLIDRRGQIAQPVIPTGGCGQPLDQILIAVQRVPWVTVHAATPAH
jgi:hypothetical protein